MVGIPGKASKREKAVEMDAGIKRVDAAGLGFCQKRGLRERNFLILHNPTVSKRDL